MTPRALTRRPLLLLAGLLVALGLLPVAGAQAAAPSILNTGTGCSGQTAWLVTCATGGQGDNSGNQTRMSVLVNDADDQSIASLITDDDYDGTSDPSTVRSVSAQRPTIASGYPRSRANLTYTTPTTNTGMSCNSFTQSGTRRTSDRNVRIQARDTAGETSGTSSSIIKFVGNSGCGGPEDYAYLYGWGAGNFNNSITPGSSVTYTYNGDDPDSGDAERFMGVRWRLRNIRTGAVTGTTTDCDADGDNAAKQTTVTFPDRGAFVVEAELLNSDGGTNCNNVENAGYWFALGTADVNSSSIPAPGLSATRPQTNGNTTITLDPPTDPDSADGGGVQIIQWDLDFNTSNGASGFETDTVAGVGATITTNQTKTIDTTGLSPGTYTVRARVIDNGAIDAADSIRRTSSTASTTFTVNSPPVAQNQNVTAETGEGKAITLEASDANNDSLSYTITSGPSHGTLSGFGSSRTYTSDGDYSGSDSFTFEASDGFGGTSTGTVTIDVAPQTQIDSGATPNGSPNQSFTFSSPVSGASFECSLDGDPYESCASPKDYTNLSEGSHTFEVRAVFGGLTDPTPASETFSVDQTDPETTIDAGPDGLTRDDTPTFEFSSNEATSTFECRVDAEPYASCTSPHTTAQLGDGPHTFSVRATDGAGNADDSPAERSFTVDATEPETTIDSGPDGPTDDGTPQFEFSSDEANSTFECRVDTDDFTPCTSPTSPALTDGQHTFEVRATDAAGNTDPTPASRSFTVDTVAPETTIDAGPAQDGRTGDSTPTFEFSSDSDGATFECRIDDEEYSSCASPFTPGELADGNHTFRVRASDEAGNTDTSPASRDFIVDTLAPDTVIDSGPTGLTRDNTPTFEFHSDEPNSTFECRVDAGAWNSCVSPTTPSTQADGPHTFEVRATDAAGNVDTSPAARSFTVDTTAPTTSIDVGPSGPTNDPTPTFEFSSDDPGGTFECSLDSAPFESCTSPVTTSSLSDGAHTFEVRSTDAAGNTESDSASRAFTVDTVDPDTTIDDGPSEGERINDTTPTFGYHSSQSNSTFECRIDDDAYAPCGSEFTSNVLPEGQHSFSVRATDRAGNQDGSAAVRSFVVDTTAPQTSIDQGPGSLTRDNTPSFEFASTESGSSFSCRIDTAAFAPCNASYTSPPLSDGQHTLEVAATDVAGNPDTSPASSTFTVDADAPETSINSGPTGLTNDPTPTFGFASDEPGSSFECRVDLAAYAPCSPDFTTAPLVDGPHTFRVRATDPAGNPDSSPAEQSFTVDATKPSTTITGGPAQGASTNDRTPAFSFGSNESNSSFECRIDTDSFSPCTSPYEPASDLDEGQHTFDVRATDPAGNTESPATSRAFIVDLTPPQTAVDTGPSGSTNERRPEFTFSSSEPNSTFKCRIDGAVYAACGPSFTSPRLDDGAHTFEVIATDSATNEDQTAASRSFVVDTDPPNTAIDSGPEGGTNDTTPTFAFSSTGGGVAFQCRIDSAAFASCSSPFTAGQLADGSHTFEVRAVDAATNADPTPAIRTFSVDGTDPQTTIGGGPTGETTDRTPTFEFGSSDANSTFDCWINDVPFPECSSPFTAPDLGDGSYTFEVRATDPAGNLDETPDSRSFVVDTRNPETIIDSGPTGVTEDASPEFEFSSNEPRADFECSIDGAAFEACDSPFRPAPLADGEHELEVRAIDSAGNTDGSPASRTFTVSGRELPDDDGRFKVGPVKLDERRGTAKFDVEVPAAGQVALKGRGVRSVLRDAGRAGHLRMKVVATGAKARKLEKRGSVAVRATVSYAPERGGTAEPDSKVLRIRLVLEG